MQYTFVNVSVGVPRLDLWSISQDRGYWNLEQLKYTMASNMEIEAGTTKRQRFIPFTYDQDVSSANDTRELISTRGAKTLFSKSTTFDSRQLNCIAYRDGHKKVTIGISTEHGGEHPCWDFVPVNPDDITWYENKSLPADEQVRKSFSMLGKTSENPFEEADDWFVDMISQLLVRALTTGQVKPEWFFQRKFALTSSTTDSAIAACEGVEEWLEHKDSWQYLNVTILATVAAQAGQEPDAVQVDDESLHGEDATEEVQSSHLPFTLDDLLTNSNILASVKHRSTLEPDSFDAAQVRSILKKLGRPTGSATGARTDKNELKAFFEFIRADIRLMRYYFQKQSLIEIAVHFGLKVQLETTEKKNVASININKIRSAVVAYLEQYPEATMPTIRTKVATPREARQQLQSSLGAKEKLLRAVIQSSYMKPLTGQAKGYCSMGHKLEAPLMRACLQEHANENTKTPTRVLDAYTAPLVERKTQRHVRDSIDFLGKTVDCLIGVEIKSRVSVNTERDAKEHLVKLRDVLGDDSTAATKYFEVDADSGNYRKCMESRHETIQVLHHAYTYGLSKVLLLVGNKNGTVIYGLFVNFSEDVKQKYGEVLEDIYNNTIKSIYENTGDVPFDYFEKMDPDVLASITVNGDVLDRHSFEMDLALFRSLLKKNAENPNPIPPIKHNIPLIFSVWNSLKGGSDATTNLFWRCKVVLPTKSSQASAVSRMLLLCSVWVHRLHQIASKNPNSESTSLRAYRNLASKRSSFKNSLFLIIETALKKMVDVGVSVVLRNSLEDISELAESETGPSPLAEVTMRLTRRMAAETPRIMAQTPSITVPLVNTGVTPQRNVRRRLSQDPSTATERILRARNNKCTGVMTHRLDAKGQPLKGTCAICKSRTLGYCSWCRQSLCTSLSKNRDETASWPNTVLIQQPGLEDMCVVNSCFWAKHADAVRAAAESFNNEVRETLGVGATV